MSLLRPMRARDTAEEHRPSTPLELFYDLCFVVAVARAADRLHHALAAGDPGQAVAGFAMVFFAVWWAWMNFTWFASAYDTDDVPYRLAVLVQIAGVLILAAGVPRIFDHRDFAVGTLGYVVMRSALIAQWLRAAHDDAGCRRTALRYALGVGTCEAGWVGLLALPERWRIPGGLVLVAAELLVPVWAERAGATAWHPRHIAERYGLFTIIVLGESVLAASAAVQTGLDAGTDVRPVAMVAAGGLLIVFAMWWIYFDMPVDLLLDRARRAFVAAPHTAFAWGYGHFVVYASAAAVGAGLQVAVDRATGHAPVSAVRAGTAVTVPVALFLLSVWVLYAPHKRPGPMRTVAAPLAAALVLATTSLGQPALATGLVLTALIGASLLTAAHRAAA